MKSISAKIMLWTVGALVVSLAVFIFMSRFIIGTTLVEGIDRFNRLHYRQALTAYQSYGSAALARYLKELNEFVGAQHYLLDQRGMDLATGQDRSDLVRGNSRERWSWRQGDQIVFGHTFDSAFIWVGVSRLPFSPAIFAPFYLLMLATVGALYWLVTAQIAAPLRRLAGVVERFGRGELDARAVSRSRDEIGNLGRSFNAMADRIQILLTAERQLLQDVSHELRSPLARLTFEAEMVRRSTNRDTSAARLRQEIERLSELVGSLIDMARAEGDPATFETEQVCLHELLQDIVDGCAVEASAKGCGIRFEPGAAVEVRGNEELLHRAFENVVRNAIRYTPAGTTVAIGLSKTSDSALVTVRDHGPGIPAELLTRVFDPFFRVDASRDAATGGVGLGLAIARRAIRAHKGGITAGNAGPGALFSITLPLDASVG